MKTYHIILTHIGFWVFVILIRIPMIYIVDEPVMYSSNLFLSMFLHIVIFYLFYFIFGRLLIKRMIWQFMLFYIIFLPLYSIPVNYFYIFVFSKLEACQIVKPDKEKIDFIKVYISVLTTQSIYALLGAMFSVAIDWYKSARIKDGLEKQNIKNELALLRSQINPHFLFNTLNNLHSFVHRDQERTAYGIIKLSEIMRYMLYEANADKVPLEREIKHIENFIELQRMRLKEPNFVAFGVEGNIHDISIPPLLLITFVENAFKHGSKIVQSPGIIISLKTHEKSLSFEVVNYLAKESGLVTKEYTGFGLKNIRRRLDLIYGKNYTLEIDKDSEIYKVTLTLQV